MVVLVVGLVVLALVGEVEVPVFDLVDVEPVALAADAQDVAAVTVKQDAMILLAGSSSAVMPPNSS